MKRILVITTVIAFCYSTFAQTKDLTLEDAILKSYSDLAPKNISQLQWMGESDNYVYVENDTLFRSNPNSSERTYILSKEDLGNIPQMKEEPKFFPYIKWKNENELYFKAQQKVFKINLKSNNGAVINLDGNSANVDIEENNFNAALTIDNNLYIRKSTDTNRIAVSNEANKGIVFGQAVHRNEFGINKGTFWSPTGNKLAFYRMDESMVTDYPLINMTKRVAEVDMIKYPMAGMKSHHVTVGVYDINSGKTIYLKTGEPKEQYLTCVTWSPDENYIFIGVLNRDQNHLKMNMYNAKTGDFIKTLFEEKDEQFVEPEHELIFVPGENDKFLWFSSRDNYKQLYLYNTSGKLIKKITKGDWDVTQFLGFDKENNLYFEAATNFGLERQLFLTTLKGKQKQVSRDAGTHRAMVNGSGLIIDDFSNVKTPRAIKIKNNKGFVLKGLLYADNPLENYNVSMPELVKLQTSDGMQLNGRIIKPANFDPNKKYPVLVYVYGGSHAQLVRDTWMASASLWMYYFASKGYIVFTLDNRGSHNRSMDFEQATHRNLGDKEMEDQLIGVNYLKSLPYVDANRMAVHGWSFGGFMTSSLMLRQPDVFKVGVAGGPVIDWSMYEVMYGERYMDTPEQNPEGYKKADVSGYIKDLKGKLLIIHGQVDPVVVPQHSMKLLKAAVDNNVQIDFFTYPGHPHNVRGKDRVHLMKKVLTYIEENL